MTKRFVSVLLVVCLVSQYLSCTTTKRTLRCETPIPFPEYDSIVVHMKDGSSREFAGGSLRGETFVGKDQRGIEAAPIPLGDVMCFEFQKTEVSLGKTLLVTVGVLGATALAGLIILMIASCPQVSSFDGTDWILEAEPHGGAITATSEYDDYNVLERLRPTVEGTYRIRFENNLEEIDFNNEVKLLAVDHDPGLEVLCDVNGELLALADVRPFRSAVTDGGVDLRGEVDVNGRLFWDGDREKVDYDAKHPRDEIHLTFERPAGAPGGVLVFQGSSTVWGMYVMAEFLSRFGKSAAERFERLEDDPAGREKVERFLQKSGYFIEVFLKEGGAWREAGHFRCAGMYAPKTQALKIDLAACTSDTIEVKLSYAPYFWNIMRLDMAFRDDASGLLVTECAPLEAVDASRGDVLALLAERDDLYYRAVKGDRAELSFPVPPLDAGRERTVVLKSAGYYRFILDETKEAPVLAKVWQAVKRQGIDGYSLEKFQKLYRGAGN